MREVPAGVRAAILDLHTRNTWALDVRHLERYVADFTADADFIETDPAGGEHPLHGLAAIRADASERFAGPAVTQHRMSNHLFEATPDPDAVRVWAYWSTTTCDAATGEAAVSGTGWLCDDVRRTDGGWQIARRKIALWAGPPPRPFG